MDNIIAKHTEEMKLVCAENDFLRKKVATGLGESEEQLNQSIKDALGDVSSLRIGHSVAAMSTAP